MAIWRKGRTKLAVGTDAAGHITANPSSGDSFTWSDGALAAIQISNWNMYQGYDQLGRRNAESFVMSCSGLYSQSTNFLYDGLVPVEEQYTEVVSDCATYWYPFTVDEDLLTIPGSEEGLGFTDTSGKNLVSLHDALGSTVALAGSSTYNYTYSAFGSSTQSGGPWCDSLDPCPPFWYPYRFTGREWSDVAGISQLYYTWARYYSPGLRRFISSDPMGFAGSGSNLYAYVGDDPVNATDPLGLMGFFAALADLFSGVMSGDFTWAVSCADFFTCLGAVAATEFGSFLRVATSTSGGGRQAPASAPPALTGSELSAQLAQRPGFAPTRNDYTPAPPGRHFDPRYLITVADAPVPSGIIRVVEQQPQSGPPSTSAPFDQGRFKTCLANEAGYGTLAPDALTCVGGAVICAYFPSPYSCGPALLGCLVGAGEIAGCYNQAVSRQGALGR